jgi:hypothetical protein
LRDLPARCIAAGLGTQPTLGRCDVFELLRDVNRDADRARLVRDRTGYGLADPPRGVSRELVTLAPVELLGGADQPDRSLLDQVEERQALVAVALGDRDDETKVRFDHVILRDGVAALDALRKAHLLRGGEQRDPPDLL